MAERAIRKQCISELKQKQVQKNSSCSMYTCRDDVTDCRRSETGTPLVTLPPLAPLGEHSRPGWFFERTWRTCRHLKTPSVDIRIYLTSSVGTANKLMGGPPYGER